MNAIPKDKLIILKPSPLYYGEINSSHPLTMDEITQLATPKPKNDYTFYNGDLKPFPRPTLYQPLFLPVDDSTESIGESISQCIKMLYGIDPALIGSGSIPKKAINYLPETSKEKNLNDKKLEWRLEKWKKQGFDFNNNDEVKKYIRKDLKRNRITRIENTTKITSVPAIIEPYHPKLEKRMTKYNFAPVMNPIGVYKFKRTPTTLHFFGRWIPFIGWMLTAYDIGKMMACTYLRNRDHNPTDPPISPNLLS